MKSLVWIFLVTGCSFGQQRQATPFVLPDDVALRKVDILSEGTRMAGELYALKSAAGTKLPTLIMSHGWGASDSRVIPTPKDILAGRQQEIHAERDRKLEAARQQRQVRRQSAA